MFTNLCLLYKISKLFSTNKIINIISSIISIIPIGYCLEGGNLTEEYALPFILYSFYIFIKYMKNGEVKNKEIFFNGICLSIVLFLRPNMIAVWITYIPVVLFMCLRDKKYKELGKYTLFFLVGMLLIILPVIIYFVVNNAFSDFLYSVFEFNIKYTQFSEKDSNMFSSMVYFISIMKLVIVIFFILVINTVVSRIKKT